MKKLLSISLLFFTLSFSAQAKLAIGETAPDFSLTDSNGKQHKLSDYADKTVVLEWTNHGCPYVVKHYDSHNMQNLQKQATTDGIIWLSIISSAPGKQGHVSNEEANKLTTDRGASPSAVLFDPEGTVGKNYNAKTTPHMYIVEKGKLVYMGGIDNIVSTDQSDIPKATNYVSKALAELKAGKAIADATTRPYGCSIKYK